MLFILSETVENIKKTTTKKILALIYSVIYFTSRRDNGLYVWLDEVKSPDSKPYNDEPISYPEKPTPDH